MDLSHVANLGDSFGHLVHIEAIFRTEGHVIATGEFLGREVVISGFCQGQQEVFSRSIALALMLSQECWNRVGLSVPREPHDKCAKPELCSKRRPVEFTGYGEERIHGAAVEGLAVMRGPLVADCFRPRSNVLWSFWYWHFQREITPFVPLLISIAAIPKLKHLSVDRNAQFASRGFFVKW